MVEIEIFSCKLGLLIWGIFVWFLWRLWKRGEDEEIQEKLDQFLGVSAYFAKATKDAIEFEKAMANVSTLWVRDNIHKDR